MPFKDPEKRKEQSRRWRIEHPEESRKHKNKWASENADKVLEKTRRWRKANPEKVREYSKRQYDKYPEEHREAHRRWSKANPDKTREITNKRRAQKNNSIMSLTREQESEILRAGCMFCGTHDNLTIAHDNPVSKGGNTTRGNTFCLCQPCNSRMRTKTLAETIKQLLFPF